MCGVTDAGPSQRWEWHGVSSWDDRNGLVLLMIA